MESSPHSLFMPVLSHHPCSIRAFPLPRTPTVVTSAEPLISFPVLHPGGIACGRMPDGSLNCTLY